jgi:hypothetical protein
MSSNQLGSSGLPGLDSGYGTERAMSLDSVGLLFHSILQEDRITHSTRVLLARLQMPLVRFALAQPMIFGNTSHPSMALVTDIVACALEQGKTAFPADAFELEIRRLVVMVEQNVAGGYETCKQAHTEFRIFLTQHRTHYRALQAVADKLQEQQKIDEAFTEYATLWRHMILGCKVRLEVTDFLFEVWTKVLALSAVRHGHQAAPTLAYKQAVTALIWTTGAKETRRSRTRTIKEAPLLLRTLRDGMDLLNLPEDEKIHYITALSVPMMDAFMRKKAFDAPNESKPNDDHNGDTQQARFVARGRPAPISELPGLEVIEDYPSSQGWHFWESVQAEQKDLPKPVEVTDSTWPNPRGHREK